MHRKTICKLILIMIFISLIPINAMSIIVKFPPAASWQQGYWDTTSGSSASKTDTNMYFDIEGGGGDGDELYYVTNNLIDITNISYIKVRWKGTFAAVSGATVFGIGTVQADKNFNTNTTKTSTFSTTNTYLDVSNYTGLYYLKVGGYASSAGLADDINLWVYDIDMFNYSASFPLNATSVQETTATLRGYLDEDSNQSCGCNFWVCNQTNQFGSFIYYFDNYNAGGELWSQPGRMVDDSLATTASLYIPVHGIRNQTLNGNNCTGYDYGPISTVEIRYYGFDDDGSGQITYINLTPVFPGGEGDVHSTDPSPGGTWCDWQDITTDTNAPATWTWNDIVTLNVNVSGYSATEVLSVAKVQIRVSGNSTTFTAGAQTEGSFSASATGLTSGEYYYVRTVTDNGYTINASTNETYFLTKPNAPTSFSVSAVHPKSIDLQWTNATLPAGMINHSVLIHYSTASPPGAPTPNNWGTFAANVSDSDRTTIPGLAEDTTYYFVAWTYINNSGSPSMGKFSTAFATTSGTTEGGIYNITVRYENETAAGGNCVVNLSHWRIHKFLIHTSSGTDFVTFDNGIHTSTLQGYFANNESGNFSIEINATITYIEFHWNSSVSALKHCYRIQIPESGERNITFYIRTDLPVYGEGTTKEFHTDSAPVTNPGASLTLTTSYSMDEIYGVYVYNISVYPMWETVPNTNYTTGNNQIIINNSVLNNNITMAKIEYYTYETVSGVTGPLDNTLVKYTYYFKDETSVGYYETAPALDAWTEIYCYNATGVKLSIHKEFWSSDQKIYPWLIYNKKYYVGVGCTELTLSRIGIAPTGPETSPDPINIPDPQNITYSFFDIIDIDAGWNGPGSGFYVYYQDTLYGTYSVTFRVWDRNGTMVYNDTSDQDYKNFTYSGAWWLYSYNWTITTNHTIWLTNQTIQNPMPPGMTPISDITSIGDLINKTFGNTPFVNFDTGEEVSWPHVLVFVIGFILCCSIGAYNAYVGTMAVGLWLTFSAAAIQGIPIGVALVGVFLIAMAVVFAMGGKYR